MQRKRTEGSELLTELCVAEEQAGLTQTQADLEVEDPEEADALSKLLQRAK